MAQWLLVWIGLSLFSPVFAAAAEHAAEEVESTPQQTSAHAPVTTTANDAQSATAPAETDKPKEESTGDSEPDCE